MPKVRIGIDFINKEELTLFVCETKESSAFWEFHVAYILDFRRGKMLYYIPFTVSELYLRTVFFEWRNLGIWDEFLYSFFLGLNFNLFLDLMRSMRLNELWIHLCSYILSLSHHSFSQLHYPVCQFLSELIVPNRSMFT